MEQYLHSFVKSPRVLSEVCSFLSGSLPAPAFPEGPARIAEPAMKVVPVNE